MACTRATWCLSFFFFCSPLTHTHTKINYNCLQQSKIITIIISLHKNLYLIQIKLQFKVIYKKCGEAQQMLEAYQTWVPHTMWKTERVFTGGRVYFSFLSMRNFLSEVLKMENL